MHLVIKTTFNYFLVILCSAALIACAKDDNMSPASDDMQTVSDFLMNDRGLVITLLTDDRENETYYFESFLFNFNADGTVAATNATDTVNGTFSVFRDDGKIELKMNFSPFQNFTELNDDWYFISINEDIIRFDDDGDKLEFQQR